MHNYQSPGEFPYTLVAYNDFGCADTGSGTIIIDDIGVNYVPSIFTPNGDDVNEKFTNSYLQPFKMSCVWFKS